MPQGSLLVEIDSVWMLMELIQSNVGVVHVKGHISSPPASHPPPPAPPPCLSASTACHYAHWGGETPKECLMPYEVVWLLHHKLIQITEWSYKHTKE